MAVYIAVLYIFLIGICLFSNHGVAAAEEEHPWKHELIPEEIMMKYDIPDQNAFIQVERICDSSVILLSNAPRDGYDMYVRLSDHELLLQCSNGRIRPTNPNCFDTMDKICKIAADHVASTVSNASHHHHHPSE
jgi:hypothetical protein